MIEQRAVNSKVVGLNPTWGVNFKVRWLSGQKQRSVKPSGSLYVGSNPTLTKILKILFGSTKYQNRPLKEKVNYVIYLKYFSYNVFRQPRRKRALRNKNR